MDDLAVEFMEIYLKLSPEQRTIVYDFIYAIKDMTDNQALDDLAAEYKKALRSCIEERTICFEYHRRRFQQRKDI